MHISPRGRELSSMITSQGHSSTPAGTTVPVYRVPTNWTSSMITSQGHTHTHSSPLRPGLERKFFTANNAATANQHPPRRAECPYKRGRSHTHTRLRGRTPTRCGLPPLHTRRPSTRRDSPRVLPQHWRALLPAPRHRRPPAVPAPSHPCPKLPVNLGLFLLPCTSPLALAPPAGTTRSPSTEYLHTHTHGHARTPYEHFSHTVTHSRTS